MAFCSYPACVLSFPTQNSFICCWGREFPFVIPFSSLFCVYCLSEGAQILRGVPRPCHCLTASSRTEASLVSLPEVLQSVLKEQLYFHWRLNKTTILFSQGTCKERESWLTESFPGNIAFSCSLLPGINLFCSLQAPVSPLEGNCITLSVSPQLICFSEDGRGSVGMWTGPCGPRNCQQVKIIQLWNHLGWKRPLRLWNPTVPPALPNPLLNHVPKCHIYWCFKSLQG